MNKRNIKLLIIITLIIISLFFIIFFPISIWIDSLLLWINQNHKLSSIIYILIYLFSCIFLVPVSIITLAGGFIFGLFQGIILASISSTLGATISFLLGRYLVKSWVQKKIINKHKIINQIMNKQDFITILLLRLIPAIPFGMLNYSLSITNISLKIFILSSWIGMLPITILYVYLGALADNLKNISEILLNPMSQNIFLFLGVTVTLLLVIYILAKAKKRLKKNYYKK
ncbi:MAG: hypothetical protein CBC38_06570 [Gammaproteobacteria bacterium TMED78]|nr:MAG: hypothetical protein CBC38_06570 [Gammaproteobacteria bacterium TMED78]|tara:strand:+ start:746 stop:1432 length:687 start_codon:yes stop_codon:yes gene_type:complete